MEGKPFDIAMFNNLEFSTSHLRKYFNTPKDDQIVVHENTSHNVPFIPWKDSQLNSINGINVYKYV